MANYTLTLSANSDLSDPLNYSPNGTPNSADDVTFSPSFVTGTTGVLTCHAIAIGSPMSISADAFGDATINAHTVTFPGSGVSDSLFNIAFVLTGGGATFSGPSSGTLTLESCGISGVVGATFDADGRISFDSGSTWFASVSLISGGLINDIFANFPVSAAAVNGSVAKQLVTNIDAAISSVGGGSAPTAVQVANQVIANMEAYATATGAGLASTKLMHYVATLIATLEAYIASVVQTVNVDGSNNVIASPESDIGGGGTTENLSVEITDTQAS